MPNVERNLTQFSEANRPITNPRYQDVLLRLIKDARPGIVEFNGGPLDLDGGNQAWLSPLVVQDQGNSQFFHAIYINSQPDQIKGNPSIDVVFFDETEIKLAEKSNGFMRYFNDISDKVDPKIIIRPVQLGMIYYPTFVNTGFLPIEQYAQSLGQIEELMGLPIAKVLDFRGNTEINSQYVISDNIRVNSEKIISTPFGEVLVRDIEIQDDDWRYYQVITSVNRTVDASKPTSVRIDSGCDSGQLYLDRGCDCREQLHAGLEDVVVNNGVVIHVPMQDGRGYGTAVKMETEGIKRGIPMIYNADNPVPVDTITAAEMVFGSNFDLRTFIGVGKILIALGYNEVDAHTNNKLKIKSLEQAGIKVLRTPAITVEKKPGSGNVESKKKYTNIYYGD